MQPIAIKLVFFAAVNPFLHVCYNIKSFFVLQRTERAPMDSNLAEKEPEKFAAMLREKLLKVKEEQEKLERIKENLQNIEVMLLSCRYVNRLLLVV